MKKFSATYNSMMVVVCEEHLKERGSELSGVRKTKGSYSCYFCVHVRAWNGDKGIPA